MVDKAKSDALINHISQSPNFLTSVNLFLDINNKEKVDSFIETSANKQALEILQTSLVPNSGHHANILVGPYGKGKSHLVLRWLHNNPEYLKVIINGNNQDLQIQFNNALEIALQTDIENSNNNSLPKLFSNGNNSENVIENYQNCAKMLKNSKRYKGIIVVFDEFSKYLESANSKIDTKFLQDFAEVVNRVPNISLLLITHKALGSYLDDKISNELRKVEGRFNEIGLHNGFDTSKELIAAAFKLDKETQKKFDEFYPLHPATTFILPRLSEIAAQNERTMFTFLSSNHKYSLFDFANYHSVGDYLTPDYLFIYFEPQLRKFDENSDIYKYFIRASKLLESTEYTKLERKIIKTLCLIYIIGYFDQLPPTFETLQDIYASANPQFERALKKLIDDQAVVYETRGEGYLLLRESSGINISEQISDAKSKLLQKINPVQILNDFAKNEALYPVQYNDNYHILRYFHVRFEERPSVRSQNSKEPKIENEVVIFNYENEIDDILLDYETLRTLIKRAVVGSVYCNELEFRKNDLSNIISGYISKYTDISGLSNKLSDYLKKLYPNHIIYNYEIVNYTNITGTTAKARGIVIDSLLQGKKESLNKAKTAEDVDKYAPEFWTMQEKMIFWTFKKSLLEDSKNGKKFKLVEKEVKNANSQGNVKFSDIYNKLSGNKGKFGIKKGVIPLYLSVIFADILDSKKNVLVKEVINNNTVEIPLNSSAFLKIEQNPDNYTYEIAEVSNLQAKTSELASEFENYYIGDLANPTSHLVCEAINRWYYSLPNLTLSTHNKYQKLFDIINRQIKQPTHFISEEINVFENSFGKKLPEIKNELDMYLNQQYNLVGNTLGIEQNEVDGYTRSHLGLKLKDLSVSQLDSFLSNNKNNGPKSQNDKNVKLKKFEGRARLLNNEISTALKEIGTAVSQDEKLAVLGEMIKGVESGIL